MLRALLRTGLEFEPDTDDQAEHVRSVAAAAGVVAGAFPTLLDVFGVTRDTRAVVLAELEAALA